MFPVPYSLVPTQDKHSRQALHFQCCCTDTLLYGLENLVLHKPQLHHLHSFVMSCLRIILRLSIKEKKRHTTIKRMAKHQKLSSVLSQHRLCYLGHISQMKDSRLPKQLLVCAPVDGKCAPGKQKYPWNDLVSRDLKSCELSEDWHEFANSRSLWRKVIHDCVESLNVLAEKEEKRQKDERKKQRERRDKWMLMWHFTVLILHVFLSL